MSLGTSPSFLYDLSLISNVFINILEYENENYISSVSDHQVQVVLHPGTIALSTG